MFCVPTVKGILDTYLQWTHIYDAIEIKFVIVISLLEWPSFVQLYLDGFAKS